MAGRNSFSTAETRFRVRNTLLGDKIGRERERELAGSALRRMFANRIGALLYSFEPTHFSNSRAASFRLADSCNDFKTRYANWNGDGDVFRIRIAVPNTVGGEPFFKEYVTWNRRIEKISKNWIRRILRCKQIRKDHKVKFSFT